MKQYTFTRLFVLIITLGIPPGMAWAEWVPVATQDGLADGYVCDTDGQDIRCIAPNPYVDAAGQMGIGGISPTVALEVAGLISATNISVSGVMSASELWINGVSVTGSGNGGGGGSGATQLEELDDVSATAPQSGDILRFNGTDWEAQNHANASMLEGWPDALICTQGTNTYALLPRAIPWGSSGRYRYADIHSSSRYVEFYNDGTPYTQSNLDASCSKNITQYYADGTAYNFRGNNAGTTPITQLQNVSATTPLDGDTLVYNTAAGQWEPGRLLATASGVAGAVQFANSSASLTSDASNLFWDDNNNRLGIRTDNPQTALEVAGEISTAVLTVNGISITGDWASTIGQLTDVSITNPTENAFLLYDNNTSQWHNRRLDRVSGTATMVPNWPDALRCDDGSTDFILWYRWGPNSANRYFYSDNNDSGRNVEFNGDGSIYDVDALNGSNCSKDLDQYYADGQAFHFVGNNNINVPLTQLQNVSATSPLDTEALIYNQSTGYWEPGSVNALANGVAGAVQFSDGGASLTSDATNFFWDEINRRLGIGTDNPQTALEVAGEVSTAALTVNGISITGDWASTIGELTDVSLTAPQNDAFLLYDAANSAWVDRSLQYISGTASMVNEWPDALRCTDDGGTDTYILYPRFVPHANGRYYYYDQNAGGRYIIFNPDGTYYSRDELDSACIKSVQQYYADGDAFNFIGNNNVNAPLTQLQNVSVTSPGDNQALVYNESLDLWVPGSVNALASGSTGAVQYADGSGDFASDANNFVWDETNNRLGIGHNNPQTTLDVSGTVNTNALFVNGVSITGDWAGELGELQDVSLTSITDSDYLLFDATNDEWHNAALQNISGTTTMTRNWPDAIRCTDDGGTDTYILYPRMMPYANNRYYYYDPNDGGRYVIFNADGSYYTRSDMDSACIKSIQQYYADGDAFNFIGNNNVNAPITQLQDVSADNPADAETLVYNQSAGLWEPGRILAAAPGGTGAVQFAAAGASVTGNAAQFNWDNANNRLGIRTNAPQTALDVAGQISTSALTVNGISITGDWASALGELTDVSLTSVTDNAYLMFDSDSGMWRDETLQNISGTASIVPNWPDAIRCTSGSTYYTLYLRWGPSTSNRYFYSDNNDGGRNVEFNADGSYYDQDAMDSACIKSVQQYYADGDAYHFLGNNSVTSSLTEIINVSATSPSNNQGLIFNQTSGYWEPGSVNALASGVAGAIQFSDGATSLTSDASNLFWDINNNRLGIGTNTPGSELEVDGLIRTNALMVNGISITGDWASNLAELADVSLTSPANESFIVYDASNSLWRDEALLDMSGAASMIQDWPDALRCTQSGTDYILYYRWGPNGNNRYFYSDNNTSDRNLEFNADGSFYDRDNMDFSCEKTLQQYYADGDAFHFVGNNAVNSLLTHLQNVSATGVGDGEALVFNQGSGYWEPGSVNALADGVAGAVQFSDGAASLTSDASNFFWDEANNRLGIRTDTPQSALEVNGEIRTNALTLNGIAVDGNWASSLNELTDISLTSISDNDYLLYDSNNSTWRNETIQTISGATSMVPNMPDVLVCDGSSGEMYLHLALAPNGNEYRYEYLMDGGHSLYYNPDGSFDTGNYTNWNQNCWNKSIQQLYSEGRAINLVGGGNVWTLAGNDAFFNAGQVGIGLTSPTTALEVSGTISATAFTGDGSALVNVPQGPWTEDSGDIYRSSGNVGIGTTAPEAELDVAGLISVTNISVSGVISTTELWVNGVSITQNSGTGGVPTPPACNGANEILQWDGTAWSCGTIQTQILSCGDNEYLKSTGSGFVCVGRVACRFNGDFDSCVRHDGICFQNDDNQNARAVVSISQEYGIPQTSITAIAGVEDAVLDDDVMRGCPYSGSWGTVYELELSPAQ